MNPALPTNFDLKKTIRLFNYKRVTFFCLSFVFLLVVGSLQAQTPQSRMDNPAAMQEIINPSGINTPAGNAIIGTSPTRVITIVGTGTMRETEPHAVSECGTIAFDSEKLLACPTVSSGNFEVTFGPSVTPEARAAFLYATEIWSRVLDISVPVSISFDFPAGPPNNLGATNTELLVGPDAPNPNVFYPASLYQQFAGMTLGGFDMTMTLNSIQPWYFGLDGCPAAGEFDFVSTALHEIAHGLGFLSSAGVFNFGPPFGNLGCYGFYLQNGGLPFGNGQWLPYIADLNLVGSGFDVSTYDPAFCYGDLNTAFTGGDLFFTGANTEACVGGPVQMYAPGTFNFGSSVSHFDELTFPTGTINSMMTPFGAPGEAVHDPGCALSYLQDIGWTINDQLNGQGTVSTECSNVPTMSEWGLMIFGLLILNMSVILLRRKESVLA